ncbi:DNA topoisomerase I, partial [candidate division KSB1 bacterium]
AILVEHFPDIFNVEFTAKMEAQLDSVEAGKKSSIQVLQDFYNPFNQALQRVDSKKTHIKQSLLENTGEKCPECGRELVIKWGRNGKFMACSGYPDCKYTRPIEEEQLETEISCDLCGSPMVVKTGKFGRFLACSAYPKCKNTKPLSIGVPCPRENCDGEIVEKRTRRGKIFYGCSRYPDCDFATWNLPVNQPCSQCHNPYLELRVSKAKGEYLYCPKCKAEFPAPKSKT